MAALAGDAAVGVVGAGSVPFEEVHRRTCSCGSGSDGRSCQGKDDSKGGCLHGW